MAIIHSPDSAFAAERRKWEAQHTEFGAPGRPYVYREYPLAMSKAGRNAAGRIDLLDQQIAHTDSERDYWEAQGYASTVEAAMERAKRDDLELAKASANRLWHEQRMSASAQAEAAAYVEAHPDSHLGEIPEARKGQKRAKGTDDSGQ